MQRRGADLTKGWLLKVKALWNTTIKDTGYAPTMFRDLRLLLNGLRENVLFDRQGYNTKHDHFSLRRKFEEAYKATLQALDEVERTYEDVAGAHRTAEYAVQDMRLKIEDETGDRIRTLGWEEFYRRYPEAAALKAKADALYDKVQVFQGSRIVKTLAPVTKSFEGLMRILYEDAADLADARERGMEVTDLSVHRVFDLHGMKVVALDPALTPSNIRQYLGLLDLAYKDVTRKGLAGVIWKGVCFIEGKVHEYTPDEMALRQEWGYTNRGQAAHYLHGKDEIHINEPPSEHVVETMIHEMGHRYWFKVMSPEQRARFNALVRTRPTTRYRDFPQGPVDDEGHEKPVAPLNEYASSNIEEAFAEVFAAFVLDKELSRAQVDSFKSVLPHKMAGERTAARVLARFLATRR